MVRVVHSSEECTDIILRLGWAEENREEAARECRRAPLRAFASEMPTPNTMANTERRLRDTGSVIVRNPDSGRTRAARDLLHDPVVQVLPSIPQIAYGMWLARFRRR